MTSPFPLQRWLLPALALVVQDILAADAQLPEVQVTAVQDATTEGSGSYTTTGPISSAAKLGLTPKETPQSMTIVTRQRMQEMGLHTLSETMQAGSTGIFVNAADTERITYNARGYSVNNFQVDGMLNSFGGYVKTDGDNVVYDRIEVIRGASGLTTGAGDPSATINQVRKRPTAHFQGHAALYGGNYRKRRGEIDLSGPLAWDGKIRARLVAAEQKAHSFRPLYRENRNVVYGIVETELGGGTLVSLGHERQRSDPRGVTWGSVPYWNADGSRAHLPHHLNLSTSWASWNMDEKKTFAMLEHELGDTWRLRAAATHSDRSQGGHLFFGYGGYPKPDGSGILSAWGSFPVAETMRVFDLNLEGKYRLLGRTHELVLGLGQSRRNTENDSVYYENPPPDSIADWRTWTGDIEDFNVFSRGFASQVARIKQRAGYVATRVHVSDPLKLIAGVRYGSYDTHTQNYSTEGSAQKTTAYKNSGVFTPYAGLLYALTEQWSIYASHTEIFQPQNYRDKNNQILDPVDGQSREVGIKGELFERRMNVAASVFRSVKNNVAELDASVPPGHLPGNVDAYQSTGRGNVVTGFEAEVSGQATRQWNIFGGYSHTRSRNSQGEAINTVVPRNLFRLFTTWRLANAGHGLTLGGGISWQSSFWGAATKADRSRSRIEQPAVTLVNVMAAWSINPQWSASLNVNNALNKRYYSRVGFYNGTHAAEPRRLLVSLRAKF